MKITGCTVHFVEELVDSGPVIIQAAVPANAGEELDDLMNRIHPLEHRITACQAHHGEGEEGDDEKNGNQLKEAFYYIVFHKPYIFSQDFLRTLSLRGPGTWGWRRC